MPRALLAFGPDLHRAELHHQGRCPATRRPPWPHPGGSRHQPARQGRGRRRRLRPGPGCRLLRERHPGPLGRPLPDVRLRGGRAAGARGSPLPGQRRAQHPWSFDGRAWCAGRGLAQSRALPPRLGLRPHRGPLAGALGPEGSGRLPGQRSAGLEGLGQRGTGQGAGCRSRRRPHPPAHPVTPPPPGCGSSPGAERWSATARPRPNCWKRPAPLPSTRWSCACNLATTTATTSSPASSASTLRGTRRRCRKRRKQQSPHAAASCRQHQSPARAAPQVSARPSGQTACFSSPAHPARCPASGCCGSDTPAQ